MSDVPSIATKPKALRWNVALWLLLGAASAGAGEIEVRGTLLCRPEGDPRRERPVDSPCLLVEPVGNPRATELVDEAGLFRVHVPDSRLDQMLLLRIRRGRESIDLIRVFLDSRRLVTGPEPYVLEAHPLPGDCTALDCPPEEALAARDSLRAPAAAPSAMPPMGAARKRVPKWAAAILAPALLFLGGGSGPSVADCCPDSVLGSSVDTLEVVSETSRSPDPTEWSALARESSSPALGRSITAWRNPGELALWNPSALALARRSGVAVGIAGPWELRLGGWVRARPAGRESRVSVAVSAATVARGADRSVELGLSDGTVLKRDLADTERLIVLGLAVAPRPDLGFGAAFRSTSSRLDVVSQVERTTTRYVRPDSTEYGVSEVRDLVRRRETDDTDFDLSATWDPSPAHRVAVAVHHVRGRRRDRLDGTEVSLREGILAYELHAARLQTGVELALHDDGLDVAGGADYRVRDSVSLDLGAGSRFRAVEGGVNLHRGRLTLRMRVRRDRFDSAAVFAALGVGG